MVGLQGAGKTTNGAKLAGYLKRELGKRPLLVACDVYRPPQASERGVQFLGKTFKCHGLSLLIPLKPGPPG
mgnify:CR=1 FL=1